MPITDGAGNLAFSVVVLAPARLHPLASVIDSSPYDHEMRRPYNYVKDDETFRADAASYQENRFPSNNA